MFVRALALTFVTVFIVTAALFTKATFDNANTKMNCGVFHSQTTNCPIR